MAWLVAFEGIDGSGKGTQSTLLCEALVERGIAAKRVAFPRYSDTVFGRAIGDFLNGRFGSLEAVNPYLASVLFAGDRFESRRLIEDAAATAEVVVFDRYVPSNVAHQSAKLPEAERGELIDWIQRVEYEVFGLPRADCVLWLDVPVDTAQALIARKAARDYTDKTADLHEADTDYLTAVRNAYATLAASDPAWRTIEGVDGSGKLRPVEIVATEILEVVLARSGESRPGCA